MSFHTVARVGELADGDILPVEIEGTELIVFRSGDDYFAAQRACLHQGGDLAEGLVSRGYLVCTVHGWKFEAATGRHELSPQTCLRTYAVRVVGDEIQVDPAPRWQGEVPQ